MEIDYLTFDQQQRPYSQAVRAGNFVFTSGALVPDSDGDIEVQAVRVFDYITDVLRKSGTDLQHAVKVSVYLADLADWERFNEVWGRYFPINKPARTTVEVGKLPGRARVEIDVVALLPEE